MVDLRRELEHQPGSKAAGGPTFPAETAAIACGSPRERVAGHRSSDAAAAADRVSFPYLNGTVIGPGRRR